MSHADPTAVAVMQVHAPPQSHNLTSAKLWLFTWKSWNYEITWQGAPHESCCCVGTCQLSCYKFLCLDMCYIAILFNWVENMLLYRHMPYDHMYVVVSAHAILFLPNKFWIFKVGQIWLFFANFFIKLFKVVIIL
jgi:hypothetical protein